MNSWGGTFGCGTVKEVWRLVSDVFNVVSLKMVNTSHVWILAHHSLFGSTFADFFDFMLFFFFFHHRGFSCMLPMC
jgi:hypothetical protein